MNIAVGQVIKRLRQDKGVTQEQLGDYLGVSYQAVSKWENGSTFPDITLLPELALFFGVTIDDLFAVNNDDHMNRIDKMLRDDYEISHENFIYASRILNQMISDNPRDAEAYIRLSNLHNARANRDTLAAARNVEQALAISPFNEMYHNMLRTIRTGRQEFDRLIFYYRKFVEKYPDWLPGYAYLAQAYLADSKPDAALKTIDTGLAKGDYPLLRFIKGDVFLMGNDRETAIGIWKSVLSDNPKNVSFINQMADRYAKMEEYENAFECWEQARVLDPTDASCLYMAAILYNNIGEYQRAIEKWEQVIEYHHTIWNVYEGESIDWPRREIERLKQKLEGKETAY